MDNSIQLNYLVSMLISLKSMFSNELSHSPNMPTKVVSLINI